MPKIVATLLLLVIVLFVVFTLGMAHKQQYDLDHGCDCRETD